MKARAKAEAAERRFRRLFEGAADAVLLIDPLGRCVGANAAAAALLGYSRRELRTMPFSAIATAEPWSRAERLRLLRGGEWHGEHDVAASDGTVIPVETRARAIETRTGPLIYAALRNIAERRAMERLQEEFIETISHDLRNPLTAIKARTQLLRRRLESGVADPEKEREGLIAIDAGIDRMSQQIDELLDVARLRAGQPLELRRLPTDLAALTRQVVREYQPLTERHQISVEDAGQPLVSDWDSARLRRVLANLLSNAVKFSPDGGPIAVDLSRVETDVVAYAEVTVSDRGLGIPARDLPHIFERFRRGSNVQNQVTGTGIGLAGALQIAEQHGGTLIVESEEGEGTRVRLRLPL
jgi:PAS domain S-box-containing protein